MNIDSILRFSMDHTQELILVAEPSGHIFYANQTAKSTLEYGESINEFSIVDIYPTVFSFEDGKLICNEPMNGSDIRSDAYRKNRTCFPALTRIYPLEEGGLLINAYDATERVALKRKVDAIDKQIEDALKVKSEFTANVTHELRTPVNGISGNTRELLEMETDPAKQRLLQLIERGCQDMHAIINNVLDFSKLEAGKFTLEDREFVFRDMIDYAVSNHKNKINEKGLDFTLTVSPDIPEKLIGDELRIVQILNNLLSNAVKFTSVGKIILEVVKTAQIEDKIELFFLVIDSGIGISKENQDKLFQSFSQVDASISRKFGGTGLGLNITKQLVEMMEGSIHLESEYGKGSMFSFHIWLKVPEGMTENLNYVPNFSTEKKSLDDFGIQEEIWKFGTAENLDELKKKLSKLVLCIEMENWEKAEMFGDTVKKLTQEAPKDIKTTALRLKMNVQKEDYEAAIEGHTTLMSLLSEVEGW